MVDYSSGGSVSNRPFMDDGDLRRRLLARIGRPLTASARTDGSAKYHNSFKELSGEEHVADVQYNLLVSSLYEVAFSDGTSASVPQEKPNGASK